MTKRCTRCGERKPWAEFFAKRKWPDGTMRQPHSRCKPCYMDAARERGFGAHHGKRKWASLKADPERLAIHNEQRRRRYASGRATGARKGRPAEQYQVPASPLRVWLSGRSEGPLEVARAAGIPARRVRAIMAGCERVDLDTADKIVLGLADASVLRELYPE